MGYSITSDLARKYDLNRANGRLCQGTSRCSTRATWFVVSTTWVYKRDEGDSHRSAMVMCGKHRNEMAKHPEGVNFVVTGTSKIPSDYTAGDIDQTKRGLAISGVRLV